jgi:hypothetical protein
MSLIVNGCASARQRTGTNNKKKTRKRKAVPPVESVKSTAGIY